MSSCLAEALGNSSLETVGNRDLETITWCCYSDFSLEDWESESWKINVKQYDGTTMWLDPDRQLEGCLAFAAEFKWRDFRSAWILLLLPCETSLVLGNLEDGHSRDHVPSGYLERHLTALLTKPKRNLTGLPSLPCEQGVCSPSLILWEIRLFIFSSKKLVFRRWSGVNLCGI